MAGITTSTWNQGLDRLPRATLRAIDMHTAGEPVRIVVSGYPDLQGETLLDKRRDALAHHDRLRKALMLEPRGHAGMYGVIPVPASSPEAAFGVLFMHNDGYSTMCGHATIAVGRWAAESGLVPSVNGEARFKLETPCGLVAVTVTRDKSGSWMTSFVSVPCFASHLDQKVAVPSFGEVTVDIAFGGAFYAILPSSRIGLPVRSTPVAKLVEAGTAITSAIRKHIRISHPSEPDLGFLYGTILTGDAKAETSEPTTNICVFADGQLDRSPTGSGVCARAALDYAKGEAKVGSKRAYLGVSGESFSAEIVEATESGLKARTNICVSGHAYFTGISEFVIEPNDPFAYGFKLPNVIPCS